MNEMIIHFAQATKQFETKISPLNSEGMAYKAQVPLISKMLIDNTILGQVKFHTKKKKKVTSKISKILQILGSQC
jgi:hypothetical protein